MWPPPSAKGYRSRAAFKLIEIDDKHRLLKPGKRVVDLGAAPGGWSPGGGDAGAVVATGKGQVVAIDILPMEPIAGVECPAARLHGRERRRRGCKALLREGRADVVLSDMAAQGTGHTRTDHLRIMALAEAAAEFACDVLAPGGAFLCKVFQGGTERELLRR